MLRTTVVSLALLLSAAPAAAAKFILTVSGTVGTGESRIVSDESGAVLVSRSRAGQAFVARATYDDSESADIPGVMTVGNMSTINGSVFNFSDAIWDVTIGSNYLEQRDTFDLDATKTNGAGADSLGFIASGLAIGGGQQRSWSLNASFSGLPTIFNRATFLENFTYVTPAGSDFAFSYSGSITGYSDVALGIATSTTTIANDNTSGPLTFSIAAVDAAVPEPATWAMMILGMGGVGSALRHRRMRNRDGSPVLA
jgi:hypothetical protein